MKYEGPMSRVISIVLSRRKSGAQEDEDGYVRCSLLVDGNRKSYGCGDIIPRDLPDGIQ